MTATKDGPKKGLSLGARLFLVTALLIVFTVASAVIFTAFQANRVAREAGVEALAAGSAMQMAFQEQRYQRLELMSELFVSDPYLIAYLSEAAQTQDRQSILDLLQERQQDLGFDFAIILDPYGEVLARTDRAVDVGEDLSGRPLVAQALADFQGAGVWRERGELFYAVAVPIAQNFDLLGFLVSGFALADVAALESRRAGGTETIVLAAEEGGVEIVASTLSPAMTSSLVSDLTSRSDLLETVVGLGETADRVEAKVEGEPWVARIQPLSGADGDPVGATATLASLRRQLEPYRKIQNGLVISGLVSVLLAFPLAFAFARRLLRPLRGLATAAVAAKGGDYDAEIAVDRRDEIGELAGSFNGLLKELREKRDMADYVAQVSRNLPMGEPMTVQSAGEPVSSSLTLLGLEYREFASPPGDPGEALEALSGQLRRTAEAVESNGGRIEAVAGHRVWARFDKTKPAVAAAAEILSSHSKAAAEDADLTAPVAVITGGETIFGAVSWNEGRQKAMVGGPVQRLESLAREALPGEIVFGQDIREVIVAELAAVGAEARERRGLVSAQPIHTLDPPSGLLLSHPAAVSGQLTPTSGGRTRPGEQSPDVVLGTLWAGRYELLSILGKGGMGVVYKAHDREINDVVALKILLREFWSQPSYLARIRDELRLARKITHPNVLRTFDLGEVDGVPFISMEYLRGISLVHLLRQTDRLPYSAGLRISGEICRGLEAVHAAGVIHRDLKPGNVLLQANGDAKLMDFGISRPVHRVEPGQTQSGSVVGTPNYLAPELLSGGEANAGTDIWACGVVLYEILSGGFPFEAIDQSRLIHKILRDDPTPMRQHWPDVPAGAEAVVMACLERDLDKRLQSATELLGRLESL